MNQTIFGTGLKKGSRKKKGGQAAVHGHAVRAVVQILSVTGKSYTIETLREKLREFFVEELDHEKRAVASMTSLELVTALLEAASTLEAVGLQVQIVNGTVKLTTARVESECLKRFLTEHGAPDGSGPFSEAALEVVACIAFKQPISQAEINQLFDTDKRHLVNVLREADMVEEFAGRDGRLQFATTEKFLRKFGISSPEELRATLEANGAQQSGNASIPRWI